MRSLLQENEPFQVHFHSFLYHSSSLIPHANLRTASQVRASPPVIHTSLRPTFMGHLLLKVREYGIREIAVISSCFWREIPEKLISLRSVQGFFAPSGATKKLADSGSSRTRTPSIPQGRHFDYGLQKAAGLRSGILHGYPDKPYRFLLFEQRIKRCGVTQNDNHLDSFLVPNSGFLSYNPPRNEQRKIIR